MTSHRSADSESGGPTKQTFTKTALYKSSVVALKRFHKIKLEITRALQLEVKTVESTNVRSERRRFLLGLDARSNTRSHCAIHWDLRRSQTSIHRHRILSERQFTGEEMPVRFSIR